ncbi:MAG: proton-conducting transporter membrane subunit [Candidatus Cloacimonadaceae bacterium]|nr:proton-conducting transporter membrane subunit [Candidatus Cloacimonadaceae bacterium]MDP3113435.1 proton-conducting transporter membrane subunit [Candidatus Cloacimonadaceae bacterium]
MMDFQLLIMMPIAIGVAILIIPESLKIIKGLVALIVSAATLYLAVSIFRLPAGDAAGLFSMQSILLPALDKYFVLNVDGLSKLIVLFIGVFGFLYALYSISYLNKSSVSPNTGQTRVPSNYYSYYLITLGASFGVALADNLLLFVTLWGLLGLTLYKLIKGHNEESSATAKKTLVLIGASDSILIMGIGLLFIRSGSFNMSEISLVTNTAITNIAFLSLLIASFTKAGVFPLHTWIPDYAKDAPASSAAFLPASLDKLLGIYFLARICGDLFRLTSWATLLLLVIGSVTIIAAVMMALVQHNYKRLLGYHAVSQVGYMVTGLALGTPLGIAAGLFHMVNHAIYKGGLFLTSGSVEKRTGKEELGELGGLSKFMPLTFISALIFALSISGLPPLNGFYSKWMIYTGIIEFGKGSGIANKLWIVWLTLALIGSALTLASFVKLISGIYLGRRNEQLGKIKEVSFLMWFPQIILAGLCVFFGVFAARWIIPLLLGFTHVGGADTFPGLWPAQSVSIMILISIVIGFIIYWVGTLKTRRVSDSFIGGEKLQEELSFSPLEFYKTIGTMKLFNFCYDKARKNWFDVYHIGKGIVLGLSSILSRCHTGILSTYLMWMIFGVALMLIILIV